VGVVYYLCAEVEGELKGFSGGRGDWIWIEMGGEASGEWSREGWMV